MRAGRAAWRGIRRRGGFGRRSLSCQARTFRVREGKTPTKQ
jgi:hypothetical protein